VEVPGFGVPSGRCPARGTHRTVAGGPERVAGALRARWRTASLASGWRFPGDWALPEVDAVCAAFVDGRGTEEALAALAGARAASGAGLVETLTDLAALDGVLDPAESADGLLAADVDATPARLLRICAVGWADVALAQVAHAEVTEPLTGLPKPAYLRIRLAELYRAAGRAGGSAADDHTLLVVALGSRSAGSTAAARWMRLTGMIIVADTLRNVFDGGETVVSLGPATAAALVPRDPALATRTLAVRRALRARLEPGARSHPIGMPAVSLVRLPGGHRDACELVTELGRP